ncbi:hypothetical protein [Sinomonas susongensis]|uniref:VG15 protein n=1 Tax=Sinomonas susongensis TaxID=1324851 RepID=UPI0011096DDD|nr:hypothetical protein [Sinomonas susongensis]
MAAPDLEAYRQANAELAKLVKGVLEDFFLSLDVTKPEAARDALLQFLPALTDQYGSVAASVAADWYEEMRASSGAVGRFTAIPAQTVPGAAVEAKVRFLAAQLWTPEPGAMLGSLLVAADKYVKQPGRDTIAANAKREGVRWARVPTGAKTCAWCLTLASRDAVYHSKASAGGYGHRYHGDCDCQPVRIAKASDYPPGYLPDNYYEMYQAARSAAQSGDMTDIAAKMRELYPDHLTDGHSH